MRVLIIILILLITYKQGYTASVADEKAKLSTVKETITKKKSELNRLSKEEKNVAKKLSTVEKELKVGIKKLNSLGKQLVKAQNNVCITQRSIELTSAQLKQRQNILLKRLNAIYKYRGGDLLEILFNTDDFVDISKRLYFMALIAKADTELIEDIDRKKNAYLQKKKILQSQYNKVSELKKTQQHILETQEDLKKEKQQLLSKIRGKKSLYQQQIAKLERESLEITQLIKKLETKKISIASTGTVPRGRGDLPWPVKSKTHYRGFGKYKHSKFDAYVVNKGIDIVSAKGETVTAVKEGKVAFADWFKGYGLLVMIDHGKGLYSLYAHLGNILVSNGQEVSKGTPIGKVGNPFGEDNYNLHFEIRVNGEPVDPLDWLMRG